MSPPPVDKRVNIMYVIWCVFQAVYPVCVCLNPIDWDLLGFGIHDMRAVFLNLDLASMCKCAVSDTPV